MQDVLSSIPWQPIWASIQRGMATVAAQSGVLAGLSLVVALVAGWRAAAAHRRLRSLERWLRAPGHDGVAATRQPDEPTLGDVLARLHRLEVAQDDTGRRVATMAEELARCVRHVAVVRFNAFPNMGGEQSFSLALLDAEGNGAVITTLAGREDTRTYAKPITAGSSPYLLSEEEREAIRRAMADEAAATGPVAGREGRRR